VEKILRMNEEVLRFTTTRPPEMERTANLIKWKKNEWLPEVKTNRINEYLTSTGQDPVK
jgi:hypothetical protein